MRTIKIATILLVALALVAGPALAGGHGCSKAKAAREAAQQARADGGAPCCAEAHKALENGEPCCLNGATEAALSALKNASRSSGCPKAASAVEAAEVAVEKAGGTIGCPKSKAAAQEAALVALKQAAEATGCPKSKAAVDAVLVAANREEAPAQEAAAN